MDDSKKYLNDLRWLGPTEIAETAESIIKEIKETQDKIANLPEEECTFESVVKALEFAKGQVDARASACYFPSYVSTDKATRDASTEANKKLEAFDIESNMREDVYKVVLSAKSKGEKLDAIDQRLMDKTIEKFERNGLALPEEERAKLKDMKKKMSELCIKYQQALNEDDTKVEFTKEELDGLPDDFLEGLNTTEEEPKKYIVTLKYPDLIPIMQQATQEKTRSLMNITNGTKCPENAKILEEVAELRNEAALLLGCRTHAEHILKIRMAKSPDHVQEFLQDLRDKLQNYARKELEVLLELKKKEKAERGEEFDGKINSWDFKYYHRLLVEKEYQVNNDEIKEYFPMEVVTDGLLRLYQDLLSLKFSEIESPYVWHEEVRMFSVHDKETEDFMGHFYLDLHPRDGKYTHAAAFPLQSTFIKQDEVEQRPSAAMVANFTKPGKDRPSLLKHNEVVTYFHEFGHIMHNMVSRSRYPLFSGTSVERDFVEAPSQMLENWCWEKEVLKKFLSNHFKEDKPLPDDMIERMVAAKNVDTGLLNLRQIFFGTFDMTLHTNKKTDTATLWRKLKKEVSLIPEADGCNPAASFGHLVGGYDAQYYGYLWSEVFSADMFFRFKKDGILNKDLGKLYREIVLSKGGSVDSIDSLVEFLGREPTQEAFLESIGLKGK